MMRFLRHHGFVLLAILELLFLPLQLNAAKVEIDWEGANDRRWPGPAIWANRLQDWSIHNGELRCVHQHGGGNWRTAHLLTHDLDTAGDRFSVELELSAAASGNAGLLLGGGEGQLSYKQASLIQGVPGLGGGFLIDVKFAAGKLSIRDFGSDAEVLVPPSLAESNLRGRILPGDPLVLRVVGERRDESNFRLKVTLLSQGRSLASTQALVEADRLIGNAAIVSKGATIQDPHRFKGLRIVGDRIAEHPERAFGPIAGVLYSVANGDLKIGVQCLSLGSFTEAGKRRIGVRVEKLEADGKWIPLTRWVGVSEPDYYALLRVKQYDASQSADLRIAMVNGPDDARAYAFHVPSEPRDGELVIGGVSCTGVMGRKGLSDKSRLKPGESYVGIWSPANLWAPFNGITEPLGEREPDIIFFTGDQLYEWWPTPTDPTDAMPVEDYLYKWILWHWSFKDLTSRVPCLLQTDDHDVWHPNLWGDGPRLMIEGGESGGGYMKSGYFVNLVQRTMCGHNPDAYDAGPNDSGITNYFCTFTYGDVDFALLEDRKFKSALPAVQAGRKPTLLGDSQIEMLTAWAGEPDPRPVRVLVSQTNYITLNTTKNGEMFADRDSNGWPKPARDRAVALFKQSKALLFTGDQHLASVSRMHTPGSTNGVYQFSQPAGGCIWWRWFYPKIEQRRGGAGLPYLGHFIDAFGNRFEALAVANPGPQEAMQSFKNTGPSKHILTAVQRAAGIGTRYRIHQGEGFGVIHVDAKNDRVGLECWPDKNAARTSPYRQFDGWPVKLKLSDL